MVKNHFRKIIRILAHPKISPSQLQKGFSKNLFSLNRILSMISPDSHQLQKKLAQKSNYN